MRLDFSNSVSRLSIWSTETFCGESLPASDVKDSVIVYEFTVNDALNDL